MTSACMTRIAASLLTAAALCLPVPAKAQCIPNPFPANWLQQQENAGGHTIAQHVGKTDLELAQRLANNPQLQTASTYPAPVAAAQATITAGLATNRNAINNWANNAAPGTVQPYDYAATGNIGRYATRNSNPPPAIVYGNTCTYRAVLRATGGGNCYLLTSYPTVPAPGVCP